MEVPRGNDFRLAGRGLRDQGRVHVFLGRAQGVGDNLKQYEVTRTYKIHQITKIAQNVEK